MKILEKFLFPELDWIQLEISGLCNAKCFYCPHTIFKKKWKGKNLSFEEFKKIIPFLRSVKLLYLQGWGEPFCNPDFFTFLKAAKEKGCIVGTTTNGMLIENHHIEKMIELNLDIIAFSLTGIKKNDILRAGTEIKKVLKVIENINEAKIKKNQSTPNINIAYMLLKSNFDELEKIPNSLSDRGINQIVISFLDYVAEESLKNESLVPKTEQEYSKLKERLENLEKQALNRGLKVHFNLANPTIRGKICSEKPLSTIFINSLGYVSPCVFTGIPVEGLNNLYFGSIKQQSLYKIWQAKNYKKFRESFLSENPISFCFECSKLRIL